MAVALMLASGFAGLAYQIVWTQQASLWLGHEVPAVLAVVTAFFGGLAVGALTLGSRIERSAKPARWYAGCELIIAAWSLVLAGLMAPVAAGMLDLIGPQPSTAWQWAVAFGGTFALLLPATAAMGATLPAMARLTAPAHAPGTTLPALYASNTAGAVLGVLVAALWLVPEVGLARTAALCAALNIACALAVFGLRPGAVTPAGPMEAPAARRALALLAATGLLGIGYEVLVVRVLSQVAENTVYTFAILLAMYLVGTALGAAAFACGWAGAGRDRLVTLLAGACLLGAASLWQAQALRDFTLARLGPGMAQALGVETLLALSAFGLPTLAMGALFSHLAAQARANGVALGLSLGVNTAAAAAAPGLFGVVLLPALGAKGALLVVVAGYLALLSPRAWARPAAWCMAAAVLGLAVAAPALVFVDVPEGGRIVSYDESASAAVSVVEDAQRVLRLRIDNHQQEGSSASAVADARQAWLPLLLHPAPRSALFLGLGTGVTASAAALDPALQVDAVELLPAVIEASKLFQPGADPAAAPANLHLVAADARRFVRVTPKRYDLIVSDNFHPARSGSGALYTVEHFQAVRERLAPGGLFCQWLPLHQLDLTTLKSIVRSFVSVYPQAGAVLATNSLDTPVLGLVAYSDGRRFDRMRLRERLDSIALSQPMAALGLDDEFAVLGSLWADARALKALSADAPLNTDDRPIVAYRAPGITYAPDSLPRDRLLALLEAWSAKPAELVDAGPDTAWPARLAAYWQARRLYIEAGRKVRPTADVKAMLAQVQQPLLAVLQASPDFRPAYDPLLRMAGVLARSDPAGAQALLGELVRLQPARPEAAQALRRMAGS